MNQNTQISAQVGVSFRGRRFGNHSPSSCTRVRICRGSGDLSGCLAKIALCLAFSWAPAHVAAAGQRDDPPPPHAPCTKLELSGDMGSVIEKCAALIAGAGLKGADLALAWGHHGVALFRSDRFEEALESYAEALKLEPDWTGALVGRGNALVAVGDSQGAYDDFVRALSVEPNFAPAHAAMGNWLWREGNANGALNEFGAALDLNAADHLTRLNRMVLNVSLGRPSEALRDSEALLAEDEKELDAIDIHVGTSWKQEFVSLVRMKRAEALRMLGALDDAAAELELTLRRRPGYAPAAILLSQIIVIIENDDTKALPVLDRALAVTPNEWLLHMEKARVLAISERQAAAREILLDSSRFERLRDGEFFHARAVVHRLLQDYDQAAVDYGSAMNVDRGIHGWMIRRMQDRGYLMEMPGLDPRTAMANALAACARDYGC